MNNIIVDLNSETQLVEAAQYGHLESFGALYERYHSPMVALAHFLSRIQGGRLFFIAPVLLKTQPFHSMCIIICED